MKIAICCFPRSREIMMKINIRLFHFLKFTWTILGSTLARKNALKWCLTIKCTSTWCTRPKLCISSCRQKISIMILTQKKVIKRLWFTHFCTWWNRTKNGTETHFSTSSAHFVFLKARACPPTNLWSTIWSLMIKKSWRKSLSQ